MREIKDTLRRKMHLPIPEQGTWLGQVVTGYFAYHAVPSNLGSLVAFHHRVTGLWRRTLRRRSQKDRMKWPDMTKLVSRWLPQPRIQHPWPNQRFAVKHPRWKPYRESRTYGFVRGAHRDMRPYRDPYLRPLISSYLPLISQPASDPDAAPP